MENNRILYYLFAIIDGFAIISSIIACIASIIMQVSNSDRYEHNIDIFPFYSFSDENEKNLLIDTWPGTYRGSIKNGVVSTYSCYESEQNCFNISETSSIPITKWNNNTFQVNNSKTYESLYKDSVSPGEQCPSGKKPCGLLDTMNNTLCIAIDQDCPINFMIFSRSPPIGYNYTFKVGNSKSKWKIYYTNEATDRYIITSKFRISDDIVCIDSQRYNSNYSQNVLDKYKYGCTPVDSAYYNPFYVGVDSMNKYDLYSQNGIISVLDTVKGYEPKRFMDQKAKLFFRPFIGYDKQCIERHKSSFNKIDSITNKQQYIKCFEIISLVFMCLGLGLFFIKNKKQYKKKIGIFEYNWKFGIMSMILALIKMALYITMSTMNYENLCTDEFSELLFLHYGIDVSHIKIVVMMEMILLFVPFIDFVIFGIIILIYNKCIRKNMNFTNLTDSTQHAVINNEFPAPILIGDTVY